MRKSEEQARIDAANDELALRDGAARQAFVTLGQRGAGRWILIDVLVGARPTELQELERARIIQCSTEELVAEVFDLYQSYTEDDEDEFNALVTGGSTDNE